MSKLSENDLYWLQACVTLVEYTYHAVPLEIFHWFFRQMQEDEMNFNEFHREIKALEKEYGAMPALELSKKQIECAYKIIYSDKEQTSVVDEKTAGAVPWLVTDAERTVDLILPPEIEESHTIEDALRISPTMKPYVDDLGRLPRPEELLERLMKERRGRKWYFPTEEDIEICSDYTYIHTPEHERLLDYLIENEDLYGAGENEAGYLVEQLAYKFSIGTEIQECLQYLLDECAEYQKKKGLKGFPDDDPLDMLNELLKYVMDAYNSTHQIGLCGYSPDKLREEMGDYNEPMTIVPGSSHAAEMLKKAAPDFSAMGVSVDIDGNADIVSGFKMFPDGRMVRSERKIYPNDPCPCGSGKKYKKCCGRKA